MALDEPNDNDDTYANEGFTLIIERDLVTALGGVAVDYVTNERGIGFDLRPLGDGAGGCDSGSCGSSCH